MKAWSFLLLHGNFLDRRTPQFTAPFNVLLLFLCLAASATVGQHGQPSHKVSMVSQGESSNFDCWRQPILFEAQPYFVTRRRSVQPTLPPLCRPRMKPEVCEVNRCRDARCIAHGMPSYRKTPQHTLWRSMIGKCSPPSEESCNGGGNRVRPSKQSKINVMASVYSKRHLSQSLRLQSS